jgi:hypothetical protein
MTFVDWRIAEDEEEPELAGGDVADPIRPMDANVLTQFEA